MQTEYRFFLISLIILAFIPTAFAGHYSSDFDLYLEDHQAEEMIGAVITMAKQVDLRNLQDELYARYADRQEWHEAVVSALQKLATESQADVLAQLANLTAQGLVAKYRGLWIGNIIIVTATPDALDIIVARDDVEQVSPDYLIETIEPFEKEGDKSLIANVEPGLRAIRADEVWAMGYTGEGRLVSHLDTGVDGNHPALNSRWRGYDLRYMNHPEWAWLDPVTFTEFPSDSRGHGTHTMGTVCGLGEESGDTIGVAFGAEWITAGVIDRVTVPRTVQDALAAFEWIADPDGNPFTAWDVPDVCSNSWGLLTGHGYPPCDETFWIVLDGVEAAGVVVVFAAGNEGPDPNSLRRPPDRATTTLKSFAVGALDGGNPDFPVATFSSRGPSYCTPDGTPTFKPEVSAPGVGVHSAIPGGNYANMSGTSMACPHVAGVVALMRQANPNLSSEQVVQIILDTAADIGDPGEDNDYGMGIVDAYEAVARALALREGWGTLAGVITDEATGSPILGAQISVIGRPWRAFSRSDGDYSLFVPPDTMWDIKVENPPTHPPILDQQIVSANETTFVDYVLEGKVTATLRASFANPEDVSYRTFYVKGSWDNDGFYDESWSGDLVPINDDGLEPDEVAADGIFTGAVLLVRNLIDTYHWAVYSEDYGGENAYLDEGAGFQILDLTPPPVPTLVVNPSGFDNNWIISVEGDNGLSLDLSRGINNRPTSWGASTPLVEDVTYTFRFYVMHSDAANYGIGGIGGADIQFTPEIDASYDFIFDDADDSYILQVTGTEGPPLYLTAQSGFDGHVPISWFAPGGSDSHEMYYDDGILVNGYYYFSYDNLMATMFVPQSYPVVIDSIAVHVLTEGDPYWPWPDGVHDPVGLSIFLDNGTGYPEDDPVFYMETTCSPGEWIRVDVEQILVETGNFWVAMNNLVGGGEDGMGLDALTNFSANKWGREAGEWGLQDYYPGDHMIRAKVFGGDRSLWLGYDATPAKEIAANVSVFKDPSLTSGIPKPNEFGDVTGSSARQNRIAYYPHLRLSPGRPSIITDTQIIAGYNLYRDTWPDPYDRGLVINSELIQPTSYDDWGDDPYGPIDNGVTYYYQAATVYDIGGGQFLEVGPSNEDSATPVNRPPANPTNLVAFSIADTVYLSWDANTDYDIAQYRVFRRDHNQQDFEVVATLQHPAVTFSEVLTSEGVYRYRIAAVDVEGVQSSGFSNNVDLAIGAIPPRQLTASIDEEFQISLRWRAPGGPHISVLVIAADFASQFQGELQAFDDIEIVDYYDARWGTPSLDLIGEYDVVVVWSNTRFGDPMALGDVLADYVDNNGGVIILSFSFNSGYELEGRIMTDYSPFSVGSTQYAEHSLGDYNQSHPIMEGVYGIGGYFLANVAIVNAGEWVASWDTGVPFVATAPDVAVVGINEYIGDSRQFTGDMIALVHNAANYVDRTSEVFPQSYRVYKADNPSGPFEQIAELPGDISSHLDSPVPNGVDHYYYVTAVYPAVGESDPTDIAVGRGQNHPPEPPLDLQASVDDYDVYLAWSFTDLMGDLDHYNIYRKLFPGGSYELHGSSTEPNFVMAIPEGEDGSYIVVVTAIDDGSPPLESQYSNWVFVSVGNVPPLNLEGLSGRDGHVPLSWTAPGVRPTETLQYDDGRLSLGYYYYSRDNLMANRFVATSPVEVETLWVRLLTQGDNHWPWPDRGHDPVGISVWDDNGFGWPGERAFYQETICELGEWITLPIPGGVMLDGPNFWVAFQNLPGGGEDGMGIDETTDYPEHKWAREDGSWGLQNIFDGDHMIRATVVDNGGRLLRLAESTPTMELASIDNRNALGRMSVSIASGIGDTKAATIMPAGVERPRPLETLDLLGYNVYRSLTADVPTDPTHRLNDTYIEENVYFDSTVTDDTTYFYVVTSVYDVNGETGESMPSNEISATPTMGARMAVEPDSLEVYGYSGEITFGNLTISNPGGLELNFRISMETDDRRLHPGRWVPDWTFVSAFRNIIEEYNKSEDHPQETYPPLTLDRGGPDEYGYFWIDSDEPGGPAYAWVDIVGRGEQLSMQDDENDGPFFIDFDFPFYGEFFSGFRVSSNCFISFTDVSTAYANTPIPEPGAPKNLVAPFWDDLTPPGGGEVWVYTNADSAVVSWIDIPHYESGGPYTAQVILTSSGMITFNYAEINYPDNSATIGIQDGAGVIGLQVAYNQPYVHDSLTVQIQERWLLADPRSGRVPPSDDFDVTVIFDATFLDEGEYRGSMILNGYDLYREVSEITIPVTFLVTPTDIEDATTMELPTEFALSQNYPNPFNAQTAIKYALPEASHVTVAIYDLLGRKVETIVNEHQQSGYHQITWNSNNISSGVYFYKIHAGEFVETKKMVLLK